MTDLPNGWEWSTVGDLCLKPQYGWTTKSGPDASGLPYLRTTDITNGPVDWSTVPRCQENPPHIAAYLLSDGDIVVSRAGSVGASALLHSPPPAVFASYLIRLRAVMPINARYVSHYFQSSAYWREISDAKVGVAMQNVNASKLAAIPIPVPPAAEQERIVAAIEEHLSRLDAAEAALGSARRRLAHHDSALTAALMADHGWSWTTLGEIAVLKGGVTKDAKRQANPSFVEVPYLRVANVQRGHLDLREVTYIRVDPEKAKALRLEHGDVLFNEGGDRDKLGRGWVWEGQIEDCIHQNHVFRGRICVDDVDPYFVSIHANAWGRAWFEENGRQTTNLASISLSTLKRLPVPMPPIDEQRSIVTQLAEARTLRIRLSKQLETAGRRAAALRRSIMAAAFSGRLVPQDPDDEPASVLLERIRAERAAVTPTKRTRKAKSA